MLGFDAALQLHGWLLVGLTWSRPIFPVYSFRTGKITWAKPKAVFAVGKSAVVALAMAHLVEVSADRACMAKEGYCIWNFPFLGLDHLVYRRTWACSFLYNWVRETIYDARDIAEDTEEGLLTLPVVLGKRNTLILTTVVTFVAEQYITGRGMLAVPFFESILRQVVTAVAMMLAVNRPREDHFTWSMMALFGLLPATWSQVRPWRRYFYWF